MRSILSFSVVVGVAAFLFAACSEDGGGNTGGGGRGGSGGGIAGTGGRAGTGGGTAGSAGGASGGTAGVAGGAAGSAGAAGRGGAGGGTAGVAGGAAGSAGGAAGSAGGAAGHGAAAGGGGAAGNAGEFCGNGLTCPQSRFCDWMDNRCGASVTSGSCEQRSQVCAAVIDRVCGCDGQIHSSPCAAFSAGVDINDQGGCTPPTGTFACGPRFCTQGTQFCQRTLGGPVGVPGSYSCITLPPACGSPATCACLSGTTCGNCTMTASGDLTTSCLFP